MCCDSQGDDGWALFSFVGIVILGCGVYGIIESWGLVPFFELGVCSRFLCYGEGVVLVEVESMLSSSTIGSVIDILNKSFGDV